MGDYAVLGRYAISVKQSIIIYMSKNQKKVAKLAIIDASDYYLVFELNKHPAFGNDTDLPGGTVEDGESILDGLLREVREEAGLSLGESDVEQVYAGDDYSKNGTYYALYVTRVSERPEITLSWEHASYEWVLWGDFEKKATDAQDTYMHMAASVLRGLSR